MRPSFTLAASAAAAAAACSVLIAPAGPASAAGNATDTINGLELEGYDVHVDRVGSAPTDSCSDGNRKFDLVEVVVSKTIQVSLNCTASA